MATKQETDKTPAQGAEGIATEQVQGQQLVAETPKWVGEVLASNKAVLDAHTALAESNQAVLDSNTALAESNQAVIDAVASFGKDAADLLAEQLKAVKPTSEAAEPVKFDEDADYEVAAGKSFRDSKDFTKEYTEGDDVTHLGPEVLTRLLAQGLIEEV